jgi:catechol 2,3-dioxygenase-like lactoylglutathione lyase family enzyme
MAAAFDASDPSSLARFWAEMLDAEIVEDAHGSLLAGDATRLGLRFVPSGSAKVGLNRVHIHLTSESAADQQGTVAKAISLGARAVDLGQRPDEGHVVLVDPEDNEFCVIEPGNAYLAGCGLFGELACEGTRSTGLFWSEVLGWPLVWDQDEETAVQSPDGGTKVAWGGAPPTSPETRNRQRFHLVPAETSRDEEVARLVALGANPVSVDEDSAVVLADPDGVEFLLMPG